MNVLLIKPNVEIGNRVPPLGPDYQASVLLENPYMLKLFGCIKEDVDKM